MTLLRNIGSQGDGAGDFLYPGGLVIDDAGKLFIANGDNGRVQVLDRSGRYLGEWHVEGAATIDAVSPPHPHRDPSGFAAGW